MKYNEYFPLVEASKTSMATVRRVLGHQNGVNAKIRERVLRLAVEMNLTIQSKPADVYAILPQAPGYFWDSLYHELQKHFEKSNLKVSYHFRSNINDGYFVTRHYLEDAIASGSKMILITSFIHEQCEDVFRQCADRCPVFLLCNSDISDKVYYFGVDHLGMGKQMAMKCNEQFPNASIIVTGNSHAIHGFVSAYSGNCIHIPFPFVEGSSKTSSAFFARKVNEVIQQTKIACIICFNGSTAKVCLALQKLRLSIPCYGMEFAPTDIPYFQNGMITATFCQDLPTMAQLAVNAAIEYFANGTLPPTNTFVPPLQITKQQLD